jgi:hypothetical protein
MNHSDHRTVLRQRLPMTEAQEVRHAISVLHVATLGGLTARELIGPNYNLENAAQMLIDVARWLRSENEIATPDSVDSDSRGSL